MDKSSKNKNHSSVNQNESLNLSATVWSATNFLLFISFQLTFARFYMPAYLPETEKAIYLDDDVIVQGKAGWTATFHSELFSHASI